MVQVARLGARSVSFFSIACDGVGGFTLYPDQFSLRFSLLVSFLGIVAVRPRGSGIRYMPNKLLLLFGEYLATGSTPGALSLRNTKPC